MCNQAMHTTDTQTTLRHSIKHYHINHMTPPVRPGCVATTQQVRYTGGRLHWGVDYTGGYTGGRLHCGVDYTGGYTGGRLHCTGF